MELNNITIFMIYQMNETIPWRHRTLTMVQLTTFPEYINTDQQDLSYFLNRPYCGGHHDQFKRLLKALDSYHNFRYSTLARSTWNGSL